MKNLATLLVLVSCTASANQTQTTAGIYLRYAGTEYDSVFFPCRNTEVWTINGGEAYDALVDYYTDSRANPGGEIKATLELVVAPIDKVANPGSQVDALARVTAIISISEDENEIISCRKNSE